MTFAQPSFLFLLLLVPLIALGAFLAGKQRSQAWHSLLAERLRPKLAAPSSQLSRWLSLGCGLLGCVLLILALAQPVSGQRETASLVRGRNLIIAIDVSRSMLVQDVAPDRLTAAKTAAFDILDRFPNDRIGLLAFAGTATLQAPLTVDHNALRDTLEQLDTSNVPTGGSNLADALNLAIRNFRETGQKNHALIVLSDGELHEGELSDASFDAKQAGVFVVSIGIGTRNGDFVPDSNENDGRFRDRRGNPVLSRLNATPLRNLADSTQGLYLEGASAGFGRKIDTIIERLDAFEDEGKVQLTPIARFSWFMIPAMILLILSLLLRLLWRPAFPRGVPAKLALICACTLVLSPTEAQAWKLPLDGYWGTRALEEDKPEKALDYYRKALERRDNSAGESKTTARLKFGEASALYRLGRYEEAGRAFGETLLNQDLAMQRDSHHQLANSLYMRTLEALKETEEEKTIADYQLLISQLEDAIAHYDGALDIEAKNEKTLKNRAQTERFLEELRKKAEEMQREEEEQQQEQQQEEDPSGQEQENEQQEGPKEGEGEESENGKPQEQEDGEEGQEGEEQEQEGGEEGEQQEGEDGENPQEDPGDQKDGEQEGESSEDSREQEQSGNPNGQNATPITEREGESAEEFARRILEENADFQKKALRQRGQQIKPNKDW